MRIFKQNTQSTPQNKHLFPGNILHCVPGRSLSYFRRGKKLAFGKNAQSIVELVVSQAAIKSLIKCTVTSITVLNCIRDINQMGKQNHVSIVWLPGFAGVHGNAVTDYLAKSGSESKMHGPEPCITVPYSSCVSTVKA